MDHVEESKILGAEGLRWVLHQVHMRGHSFVKAMSSIGISCVRSRVVSEAYLIAVHLHIKSEM